MHVYDLLRSLRARPRSWLALLPLLLGTSLASAEENEARAITGEELCKTHWTIDLDWLPYCRNQRIGELRANIRRAVIVIHGKQRNAKNYFDAVSRLANEEGRAQDTLVIALQFLTQTDVSANKLPSSMLYWDKEGWKHGNKSVNGAHLSSFEVLDRVLKRLVDQNPNLEQIVIAGHSAGAQFLQKHAAARRLDTSGWKAQLNYVIANPGTYMYLTDERPEVPKACKDTFNDYRYGIEKNRLDYFLGTSPDSMWKKLAQYPVTLMLGDEDTDEREGDTSCPALAQGKNRFERGKHFYRLTMKNFPSHAPGADPSRFRLLVVPHVGHDFERMWDSRCGRDLLFGKGECASSPPASSPPPRAAFPL